MEWRKKKPYEKLIRKKKNKRRKAYQINEGFKITRVVGLDLNLILKEV
jgi:hypothetical protein